MPSRSAGERGSVSAELAAAMPAVLLVLAVCMGALTGLGQQAVLGDLAARSARLLARGDPAALSVESGVPGLGSIALVQSRRGDLVCVTASAGLAMPALRDIVTVSGEGCAVGGGW